MDYIQCMDEIEIRRLECVVVEDDPLEYTQFGHLRKLFLVDQM